MHKCVSKCPTHLVSQGYSYIKMLTYIHVSHCVCSGWSAPVTVACSSGRSQTLPRSARTLAKAAPPASTPLPSTHHKQVRATTCSSFPLTSPNISMTDESSFSMSPYPSPRPLSVQYIYFLLASCFWSSSLPFRSY